MTNLLNPLNFSPENVNKFTKSLVKKATGEGSDINFTPTPVSDSLNYSPLNYSPYFPEDSNSNKTLTSSNPVLEGSVEEGKVLRTKGIASPIISGDSISDSHIGRTSSTGMSDTIRNLQEMTQGLKTSLSDLTREGKSGTVIDTKDQGFRDLQTKIMKIGRASGRERV